MLRALWLVMTSSVMYYWTDSRQHGIYLLSVGVNIFPSGIQLSFATCKIIRILESGILGFGIRNPAVKWNSESKFHWQRILNPQRGIQNPRLSWISLQGAISFMKQGWTCAKCLLFFFLPQLSPQKPLLKTHDVYLSQERHAQVVKKLIIWTSWEFRYGSRQSVLFKL